MSSYDVLRLIEISTDEKGMRWNLKNDLFQSRQGHS